MKEKVAAMSPQERKAFEAKQARRELRLKLQREKSGQPMEDHGFLKWTDISTSRWQSLYENLFGESLQFHQDYLLEDVLSWNLVWQDEPLPVALPFRNGI